jgi:hypothetical protein
MIRRLYETLTGRPWTTMRSAAAEFGPPPGARYAAALAAYTDAELIARGEQILAGLRANPRLHPPSPLEQHRPLPPPRRRPLPQPRPGSRAGTSRSAVVMGGGR